MIFRVAHLHRLNDSLVCLGCKRKMFWSVLMSSVMCLQFEVQEEDVLELTNGKCHLCTL